MIAARALLLGTAGIGLLIASSSLVTALLGVIVYAAGHKAFGPVMNACLMDLFPDASMGGDQGAMRTAYIGIASLGPAYVGFVAERLSYTTASVGLGACLLTSAGIVLWLSITE